jgi:hypothetical protein
VAFLTGLIKKMSYCKTCKKKLVIDDFCSKKCAEKHYKKINDTTPRQVLFGDDSGDVLFVNNPHKVFQGLSGYVCVKCKKHVKGHTAEVENKFRIEECKGYDEGYDEKKTFKFLSSSMF